MKGKILIVSAVVVVLIVTGYVSMSPRSVSAPGSTDTVVLYYGEECPHCHDVIAFLTANDIASVVPFETKETWNDRANAEELRSRAESCGIPNDRVGVPFLYADGRCLIGTPDIEGYFREKSGLPMDGPLAN